MLHQSSSNPTLHERLDRELGDKLPNDKTPVETIISLATVRASLPLPEANAHRGDAYKLVLVVVGQTHNGLELLRFGFSLMGWVGLVWVELGMGRRPGAYLTSEGGSCRIALPSSVKNR